MSQILAPSDLITRIDMVLEKDPDNIKILEQRLICLHNLGIWDEVEACINRIIFLLKTSEIRGIETVEMLSRHGKYEEAKKVLSSLTKEEQNQEGGKYYRGFLH